MPSDQDKHPAKPKMPDYATRPLLTESAFHYDRNRRQAKQARFTPAVTASGGPGVHVKLGAAFLFLTNAEARRVIDRLSKAVQQSETEVNGKGNS